MGVYSVFVGFGTQLCSPSNVCVWSVDTCVYTKLTFHLYHARHRCSVFTALWCGCSFVKLAFYLHHTPILALACRHNGTNNATHQVREYLYSTTSKVLTAIKWRMIMAFNRKLLEKQRAQNRFASYEVHVGHFFYNINSTVSFGNHLTLSVFRFQNFSLDRQTA